jgi:hypothetical protein
MTRRESECVPAETGIIGYPPSMRNILPRPLRRKKPASTATDEVLEEVKQQGEEDDTDTAKGTSGGSGDPITPSLSANRKTVEGHPSD